MIILRLRQGSSRHYAVYTSLLTALELIEEVKAVLKVAKIRKYRI